MFKSDHATPDDTCYVSLTFLIGDERYTVKRQPKQTRRVRGGGVSVANGNAWLTAPDGTIFSGVSEVNARIEAVLGLTYSQFRQIVMLPQGEFKRLLEAPSDEKQAIFRRIFGTEMLERAQKILEGKYRELDERLKATSARAEEGVAMLSCDEASELKTLIDSPHTLADICDEGEKLCKSDKTAVKNTVKKIETLNKKRDEINLASAKTANKKLDRIAELKELIAAEQAKSEAINSSETALEKARRAAEIKPIIVKAQEYRKISEDNRAAATALKAELDGLNLNLGKAKLMRDKLPEKASEKNKLLNKAIELKSFEDIFSGLEACEKSRQS